MTAPRLLPLNVDYSDKDFDSLRARLFALIRSVFPEWTDETVANFGNILVELNAFVGDVLTFYQDNQARESRITTARLRRSLLGLVKLIGYVPRGLSAATCDVTVTLGAALPGTLTLPRGDMVRTAEVTTPVRYQFLEDVVFAPGETTKTVSVEQSEFRSIGVLSSGLANQSFVLVATPYIDASAAVTFADGVYTQVDNFLSSTSADRHFTVTVDTNNRATLRFGNGVNGSIPNGSGDAEYKVGGGKAGRVEAGRLTRLEKKYTDSLGTVAALSVTNVEASSGGEDRETNAQIAINAPEAVRVQERAVAREDYEIAAQQVPGVARALFVTSNEYAAVPENEGYLFIVPVGGGAPSGDLIALVEAQFSGTGAPYPKPNTLRLVVQGAAYLDVDIEAALYRSPGTSAATAKAAVEAALDALFAVQNEDGTANQDINFGFYFQDEDGVPTEVLAWSDVFNTVRDAAGIARVDAEMTLNGGNDDLALPVVQFPRLGSVVLRDGVTGDLL